SYLVDRGIVSRGKAVLIRGSGVDLDHFSQSAVTSVALTTLRSELSLPPGVVLVTMASRAQWSKGVAEFMAAAELLKAYPVHFVLAGASSGAPDAVPIHVLRDAASSHFQWLGFR